MKNFKTFLLEQLNLYPISEDEPHKRRRLNSDHNSIVVVDAKKFKQRFEKDNNEPLMWKQARLDNLHKLVSSGVKINDHPIADFNSSTGHLSVGDGRHRISHAAELGLKIEIAVPKDQMGKFNSLM